MKLLQCALSFTVFSLMTTTVPTVLAQDSPARKELRRVDLSGAPGMEVVLSLSEYKPGDELPAHFHNGVEAGYVLEGGMVEAPGKPAFELPTGKPIMNLRDVPHGGFKIIGEKTVRLLTVHIVDKGKPLYDSVKK
jgi:quercetin dioxygenase-like cupin family protein